MPRRTMTMTGHTMTGPSDARRVKLHERAGALDTFKHEQHTGNQTMQCKAGAWTMAGEARTGNAKGKDHHQERH